MRLIAIIMATIISFMSSSICFADNNSNVKTYKFENDIKMSGVISSSEKFFNIEDNWNVKDVKLNLVFTKSELLDVDYSTITILVNDTPIESQRLSGKKEYKKETIIDIPNDVINEGYNKLTIKAYKTISDKVCRDDSNTANWLVIHNESSVNVNYVYKKASNKINEYENNYLNIDNGLNLQTSIVVPDNYSSGELSAGMILSGDFGSKIKYENFNFDFKLYSEFENKNNNVIFIGKEKNSPKEVLKLLSKEERDDLNKNCVIKQTPSPFNKNKMMLLIISNNDELLKNSAKLISSNDLISNLNKDSIIINENSDISDLIKKEDDNRVYLEELGYEDLVVKGPFSQEIIIDINTPKNKVITNNSKLNFKIRYAENLDFNRSLVTVYVNNVPIGSKKLSKDKSDNDLIQLSLPSEVAGKNYYQVKVVFNLELLDLACVTRDTDNPWAYISKESYIEFDYNDNTSLNFSNYSFPFIKEGKYNDIKIVVPNKLSSKELTNIAGIISYMGHDINSNLGDLSVVKENEINRKDKNSNLIVIGTPKNNSLIKDLNNDLNVKLTDDYRGFQSNEKIKFIGDYSSELISIQLINSPYKKDKSILAIASPNTSNLNLINKYLNDLEITKSLKGDTILLGEDGYVEDLNYHKTEDKKDKVEIENKKLNNQSKIFIAISLFLFVTIITSIILLIKKHKNN